MQTHDRKQWRDILVRHCSTPAWEGVISNLGVFFLEQKRPDIARLMWEFVIVHGDFPLQAYFNLALHALNSAKYFVEKGLQAQWPPLEMSHVSQDDSVNPHLLIDQLCVFKDLLDTLESSSLTVPPHE